MRFKFYAVILVCISLFGNINISNGQSQNYERFQFNLNTEVNEIESQLKGKVDKEDAKIIASSLGYYDFLVLKENNVILERPDLEEKIIKIANKLIESNKLKVPSLIKRVIISKQTNFNCSVTTQGTVYINIGLLAEIENEAALATVIGHEIIHFYNQDVLNANIKKYNLIRENNKKRKLSDKKWMFELVSSEAEYSQKQESIADSLGAIMAFKAGYDLRSGQNNFLTFLIDEKLEEDVNLKSGIGLISKTSSGKEKLNSIFEEILSSHPSNLNRYNSFENYIKKLGINEGKKYAIFTENEFNSLNTWAKEKLVFQLLAEAEYEKCLEKSFLFHLFDKKNVNYLYGILESSRILFRFNPKKVNEGFLSEKYNSNIIPNGKGILSNLGAFILDSNRIVKINNLELTNKKEPVFDNYDDGFNYFADLAIELKCTECLLSIAMRNHELPELKKEFLNKYLNDSKSKKKAFANAYLNNNLEKEVLKSNKSLIVINKTYTYSKGKYSTYLSDINPAPEFDDFFQKIKENLNLDSCQVIFSTKSKETEIKNADILLEKIQLAKNINKNGKNKFRRTDGKFLWEISPELWELFSINGFNNVYIFEYKNIRGANPLIHSFFPLLLKLSTSGDPIKSPFNLIETSYVQIGVKMNEIFYNEKEGFAQRKLNSNYLLNTVYNIIN